MKVVALLAKKSLPPLSTMTSASKIKIKIKRKISAIKRKIHGQGVVRAGEPIILVILNEDINNIIRVKKLL